MPVLKNTHTVKIPINICVAYDKKKKLLLIKGPKTKKIVGINFPVKLLDTLKFICILPIEPINLPSLRRKNQTALIKTLKALLKQFFIECSTDIYIKLLFVGVGYRVLDVENYGNRLLGLKLGFSHFLYLKINKPINVYNLKFIKLFICGNSFQKVGELAAVIRKTKTPEPYKGKGIKYYSEKIKIKEGKKL